MEPILDPAVSESKTIDPLTGLNLGSIHETSNQLTSRKEQYTTEAKTEEARVSLSVRFANVEHTDVEISLPRLAAMLTVNRSQANNTYAKVRSMENQRLNNHLEKKSSGVAKRPLSANKAVIRRPSKPATENGASSSPQDTGITLMSPLAVPVTISNREKPIKDPLSSRSMKSGHKRSPFNSPRAPEDDKLQALLSLTLKEYYDKHKAPPSLWLNEQDPDIPLIKQLFPINHPGMIQVSVTSQKRTSPVIFDEAPMQPELNLVEEKKRPVNDPLPQLVQTMIFDDEDAFLRQEMRRMKQEKHLKGVHKDFSFDDPSKGRKVHRPRPHSAAGNFDQQRSNINSKEQYGHMEENLQKLEVHAAGKDEIQHPLMIQNRPIHTSGLPGNKLYQRPSSAHNLKSSNRPRTAERSQRRKKKEMDQLAKMYQYADLAIHSGANVLHQIPQVVPLLSAEPSVVPGNIDPTMTEDAVFGNYSPVLETKQPPPRSQQRQRHRRLVDPHSPRSRSASPTMPYANGTKESHEHLNALDSRRAVQQMAYEIIIKHEKSLLRTGYDVPISIAVPEAKQENSLGNSSPTRAQIMKDLFPSSLQQEMQRQLLHYKQVTGKIPPSLEKPIVPLLQVAADIVPNFKENNEEGGHIPTVQQGLQLKWKHFVGHHDNQTKKFLEQHQNQFLSAEDAFLEEESSYFVTDEAFTHHTGGKAKLDSSDVDNGGVALPALHASDIKPAIPSMQSKSQQQQHNASLLAAYHKQESRASQDTMQVILNPQVHSPRLDVPYHPTEQDQLLEHLQWKHKHIVVNSLPGRKLQRLHSAPNPKYRNNNTSHNPKLSAGIQSAHHRPITPSNHHLDEHFLPSADAQHYLQQEQITTAAAAAAIAVAQHLYTMQIPCSPQQITAIQTAILQGEDMTLALDRILFQAEQKPPLNSFVPGVEFDGLPPLGVTPASPTTLGGDKQVLSMQQDSCRPLGSEDKLMIDSGRMGVTLWHQQIQQEQQQIILPLAMARRSSPEIPKQQQQQSSHLAPSLQVQQQDISALMQQKQLPTVSNPIRSQSPSDLRRAAAISTSYPQAPIALPITDTMLRIPTLSSSLLNVVKNEVGNNFVQQLTARSNEVTESVTQNQPATNHTGSVLQVGAAPLIDAYERPDIRLREQSKRYGDYVNLRNIEQCHLQQQQKQAQLAAENNIGNGSIPLKVMINGPIHSKLSPRNASPLSAQSHSPSSPFATRTIDGWKVPEISPAPPPTMVFHKSPSQTFPSDMLLAQENPSAAIDIGAHSLQTSQAPISVRRPTSARRISNPLFSPSHGHTQHQKV